MWLTMLAAGRFNWDLGPASWVICPRAGRLGNRFSAERYAFGLGNWTVGTGLIKQLASMELRTGTVQAMPLFAVGATLG